MNPPLDRSPHVRTLGSLSPRPASVRSDGSQWAGRLCSQNIFATSFPGWCPHRGGCHKQVVSPGSFTRTQVELRVRNVFGGSPNHDSWEHVSSCRTVGDRPKLSPTDTRPPKAASFLSSHEARTTTHLPQTQLCVSLLDGPSCT